jgi:hypothetical protein
MQLIAGHRAVAIPLWRCTSPPDDNYPDSPAHFHRPNPSSLPSHMAGPYTNVRWNCATSCTGFEHKGNSSAMGIPVE